MDQIVTIRRAVPADLSAVDQLLSRSYPKLLAADYPPSIMVLAIPIISRARPELLASGRYFLAEDGAGRVLACGGWSTGRPDGRGPADRTGQVRHVATDPDMARRGIGRALMTGVMQDAAAFGLRWLECQATLTAVPFYTAMGFRALHPIQVPLGPGIVFPAVRMIADLSLI
ncbi:GNAT family N-acetyltransferase [Tabrizicola sp.]|uniref:GNAT family N-acetyltransferase n=1 Tax=Tabrizicola sp. TaxID=2005166 RepID=UPI00286CB464|nr:GNAT family N-acetyltransferase [Tabrizicola sp.]